MLNRLELTGEVVSEEERSKKIALEEAAVDRMRVEVFLEAHERAPAEIILDLGATAFLRSNQMRFYLSLVAYLLVEALRQMGLAGTKLAQAQCDTLRLKLLKIGAQIRVSARRVWISLA